MKKVIFSLLLVVAGMSGVWAQRNTLLLYGTVGFDSNKSGTVSTNSYNVSPGVGYQWNDNWTSGLNLALQGSKSNGSTSNVAVGPFIRYTQPLTDVFAIYGQFNANFLSGTNYSGFQGALFPAIGVNLKNSFALNFTFGSLSFTSQRFDGVEGTANSFHFGFGSGAAFGISKNFGLKK